MPMISPNIVRVAGVGSVGPLARDPRSIPEIVLEAVEAALDDASLTHDNINAVVTASVDLLDGITASNIAVTEVVGAVMRPETRISADGLCAAIHGTAQVLAGAYETVLVVAHSKPSLSNYDDITLWGMEPVFMQSLGLDFRSCYGLQAALIAAGDDGAVKRWAERASDRRSAVSKGVRGKVSAEDVLSSPIVASPLREEMCAPMGDGACAIVLQRAQRGSTSADDIIISGIGLDLAPHAIGDRDLGKAVGLARACERAYRLAGITDPASEIDLAEPSSIYPHEDELFLEATGLCPSTTISPDGGLFAGYVPVVAGLGRLAASVGHMRANTSCRRALAHGAWGPAGQGQAVAILERGLEGGMP